MTWGCRIVPWLGVSRAQIQIVNGTTATAVINELEVSVEVAALSRSSRRVPPRAPSPGRAAPRLLRRYSFPPSARHQYRFPASQHSPDVPAVQNGNCVGAIMPDVHARFALGPLDPKYVASQSH